MFLSTDQKERDSATAYRECDMSYFMRTGAVFYLKSFANYREFQIFSVPELDFSLRLQ